MFGLSAFAQSTFAGLGNNNRVQYANNGTYTYIGQSSDILQTRYLSANNGTYTYIGQSSDILQTRYLSAENGTYTYNGFTSTNKLFIGNWEIEEDIVDIWSSDEGASSAWAIQTPPTATWN